MSKELSHQSLTFGHALDALKEGWGIRRKSWKPGFFIFAQVPAEIPSTVVPGMQSLPQQVKSVFEERFKIDIENGADPQKIGISYKNQIAHVDQNNVITEWSITVSDVLAEDWVIYNEKNQ